MNLIGFFVSFSSLVKIDFSRWTSLRKHMISWMRCKNKVWLPIRLTWPILKMAKASTIGMFLLLLQLYNSFHIKIGWFFIDLFVLFFPCVGNIQNGDNGCITLSFPSISGIYVLAPIIPEKVYRT